MRRARRMDIQVSAHQRFVVRLGERDGSCLMQRVHRCPKTVVNMITVSIADSRLDRIADVESGARITLQMLDEHLRVDLDCCTDEGWRQCADVLYCRSPDLGSEVQLARRMSQRYPGCLLTSVRGMGGGCVSVSPGGTVIVMYPVRCPARPMSRRDHAVFASFLHGWLVASQPMEKLQSAFMLTAGRPYVMSVL